MNKRFSSPNPSFPKNFAGSLPCRRGPAGRHAPVPSPGGMTKKAGQSQLSGMPPCAGFGWAGGRRRPAWRDARHQDSKVFGGMGGVGGRAPLFTKGPFPPRKQFAKARTSEAACGLRHLSQKLCRVTAVPTWPGRASRACSVPRRHDKKGRAVATVRHAALCRVWLGWGQATPGMARRPASGQ